MTPEGLTLLQALTRSDPEQQLRPEAVLEAASDPDSPLHPHFEWDDGVAGHAYRLYQARVLIQRVHILNPAALHQPPQPVYVSLMADRTRPGGGYREVSTVLASDALRAELLETALRELASWTRRYHMLTELVSAVSAAAQAEQTAHTAKRASTRRGKAAERTAGAARPGPARRGLARLAD